MTSNPKIYIAGHRGMVGSAIMRELERKGYTNLVCRTRQELDLTNQLAVQNFFHQEKPDQVYLAAARVGGIYANNTFPAEFIYDNVMVQSNVIHQAFKHGVKKLLFLGSSCIYPKLAGQPMREDALLSGELEPTNEPYAIAKIAGIKLCESYNRQYGVDYRSIMPTNLFGPGDNYQSENSHVIPALIRRFYDAKISNSAEVSIWGSGSSKREFLYVDDMAEASIHIMNLDKRTYDAHTSPMRSHINAGYGDDISIEELAKMISQLVGYKGKIKFDAARPDGSPRKLMNSSLLNSLGWKPSVALKAGLEKTYKDFIENNDVLRMR